LNARYLVMVDCGIWCQPTE